MPHAAHESEGHRKIERRALLANVGRSEIDGHALAVRKLEAAVAKQLGVKTEFFVRSTESQEEPVAIVMTGALALASAELSLNADARHTRKIVDGVIDVLSRLGTSTG